MPPSSIRMRCLTSFSSSGRMFFWGMASVVRVLAAPSGARRAVRAGLGFVRKGAQYLEKRLPLLARGHRAFVDGKARFFQRGAQSRCRKAGLHVAVGGRGLRL